ncbi:MAG: molybdate ABC transporter substrate-binding protein [Desulfobacteraceae bacterium]|nr:molybdate ABC transporter substrate-binding protein [Desulfobacteraceae bacterium]
MALNIIRFAVALVLIQVAVAHFFSLKNAEAAQDSERVVIFAAKSTVNAVTDICRLYKEQKTGNPQLSFAASSTLAKQISNGAPADIFLSANTKWMDYLEKQKMIDPNSRIDLLGNRIVLIAPLESPIDKIEIEPSFALVELLADQRLAMGDPDHVPSGIYGKQAFENLKVWKHVKDRLARGKDVRSALMLVERAEAPIGQVYATDAAISKKVRVIGTFPQYCHPPIAYPVALTAGKHSSGALHFMDFLKSAQAKHIFQRYGFIVY